MKKLLLFVVFAFAFGINMMSQNFYGGLILGGNVSQVGGDARGGYNKVGVVDVAANYFSVDKASETKTAAAISKAFVAFSIIIYSFVFNL